LKASGYYNAVSGSTLKAPSFPRRMYEACPENKDTSRVGR